MGFGHALDQGMTCLDLLGWMGHRSSSHLTDHERHHRNRQHGSPARHAGTAEQHGRPARQTNTADQHGRLARQTSMADQHGRPARQTSTADQHGRPTRQTSTADQQMVAEDPRKRRSLNIGLLTRCQRLRPAPSWQEHASSTSAIPPCSQAAPVRAPRGPEVARAFRYGRYRPEVRS